MQILYLVPPAVLLWRSFAAIGGAAQPCGAGAGDGGGPARRRSRLADISGEDAPDLVATAPVPAGVVLRAKIEAVIAVIAAVFGPLVAVIAVASPWHALIPQLGIVIAAAAATAIQLWFRTQAKRSQFRRSQVSSRVATFAEAFSSISWAATAGVAAISLWFAIAPALIALAIAGGARFLSPRERAA